MVFGKKKESKRIQWKKNSQKTAKKQPKKYTKNTQKIHKKKQRKKMIMEFMATFDLGSWFGIFWVCIPCRHNCQNLHGKCFSHRRQWRHGTKSSIEGNGGMERKHPLASCNVTQCIDNFFHGFCLWMPPRPSQMPKFARKILCPCLMPPHMNPCHVVGTTTV